MTRFAACVAALALVFPGAALARTHRHSRHGHKVHRIVTSPPKPIVSLPHIYDAGGNGGELNTPPGMKVTLFDPTEIAQALGNEVLNELGLPPV